MKKCAGTCSCGRVTGVTHKIVLVREILMPEMLLSFDVKTLGSYLKYAHHG